MVEEVVDTTQVTQEFTSINGIYRKFCSSVRERAFQGDIYRDIAVYYGKGVGDAGVPTSWEIINYKFGIIVSQDCDLLSDLRSRSGYNQDTSKGNDKHLSNVLILPCYSLKDFSDGNHIKSYCRAKGEVFGRKKIEKLKDNKELQRLHYLEMNKTYQLPELVVDFKHYFSLPIDFFYENYFDNYVCSLEEVHREHFSQRFTGFLGRIGLP